MNVELFEEVDRYIDSVLSLEDDTLRAVDGSLDEAELPRIAVSAAQGKFLHLLARISGAKRILELGTLAGYSTIWLARALPPHGRLITIEADPVHAGVARKNIELAGLADRIDVRIGKALDVLPQLEAEGAAPFDLIFIDADKPPYTEYFQWALRLSRSGTLIIADNVVREGDILDANSDDERVQGVRRFNAALGASTAVTATILQLAGVKGYDGMAFAVVI